MRKGERKRQLLAHARALLTADGLSAVTPERINARAISPFEYGCSSLPSGSGSV